MTEQIKDLIEKINEEGVRAAEEKARSIEDQARKHAQEIISRAKQEAEKLTSDAQERVSKMEEKQKTLLAQAGRDLLLSLRKEINVMLEKIVISELRQAFTPERLATVITEAIKSCRLGEEKDIEISLSKADAEALEKHFLTKLKDEAKKGITLKPSEEVLGGFSISYDNGKSRYDFTDKALAEYIGLYLKPKLNQILQDAVSQG